MRVPSRDVLATLLVGAGVIIYAGQVLGFPLPWLDAVPAVAIAILVLGMMASMSAVVPLFDELIHGSRPYLVTASALGFVALAAGIWAIVRTDPLALMLLVICTVAMWAMSTARHVGTAATA